MDRFSSVKFNQNLIIDKTTITKNADRYDLPIMCLIFSCMKNDYKLKNVETK